MTIMSLRWEGRISVEVQTGFFLNTQQNNTQYIGTQHANTILQYVLFLEFTRAKNCSTFEWHETNNHKDRTCIWVHKLQYLFHHGMKRTAKIHNHLFSSEYRIILVNI